MMESAHASAETIIAMSCCTGLVVAMTPGTYLTGAWRTFLAFPLTEKDAETSGSQGQTGKLTGHTLE